MKINGTIKQRNKSKIDSLKGINNLSVMINHKLKVVKLKKKNSLFNTVLHSKSKVDGPNLKEHFDKFLTDRKYQEQNDRDINCKEIISINSDSLVEYSEPNETQFNFLTIGLSKSKIAKEKIRLKKSQKIDKETVSKENNKETKDCSLPSIYPNSPRLYSIYNNGNVSQLSASSDDPFSLKTIENMRYSTLNHQTESCNIIEKIRHNDALKAIFSKNYSNKKNKAELFQIPLTTRAIDSNTNINSSLNACLTSRKQCNLSEINNSSSLVKNKRAPLFKINLSPILDSGRNSSLNHPNSITRLANNRNINEFGIAKKFMKKSLF